MEKSNLIPITEVHARFPMVSRMTISRMVQSGVLRGTKVGKKWFAFAEEVDRMAERIYGRKEKPAA